METDSVAQHNASEREFDFFQQSLTLASHVALRSLWTIPTLTADVIRETFVHRLREKQPMRLLEMPEHAA